LLWAKAMSSHTVFPQDLITSGSEQYSLEDADLRVWSSRWLPAYLDRKMKYGIAVPSDSTDDATIALTQ